MRMLGDVLHPIPLRGRFQPAASFSFARGRGLRFPSMHGYNQIISPRAPIVNTGDGARGCKIVAYLVFSRSRTSLNATGDSSATAIRFGIDIRPLNVSAMSHRRPRSSVAPTIAISEKRIMNGLMAL